MVFGQGAACMNRSVSVSANSDERWSMPEPETEERGPAPADWNWKDTFEPDPRLLREKTELKRVDSFSSLHPLELFAELEDYKLDALNELKSVLKHELETTASQFPEVIGCARLLRYLKGFKYNVADTAEVIRTSLQWRADNNVDKVRNEIVDNNLTIEDLPNFHTFSHYWHVQMFRSQDKEGNPIIYDPLGALNVPDLLEKLTKEQVVTFFMYLMEYRMIMLDRMSRQAGHLVFVYEIKDIAGLDMKVRHAMDIVSAIGKMTASNYVETVRRVSIINTPFVFKALYALVTPLIPARTVHKIRILGAGTDELKEDIDADAIDPAQRIFDPRPFPKPPPKPPTGMGADSSDAEREPIVNDQRSKSVS